MDQHWFAGAQLTITDMTGKVVWASDYDYSVRNIDRIDLSNQPAGIYFVNITNAHQRITEKLILTN